MSVCPRIINNGRRGTTQHPAFEWLYQFLLLLLALELRDSRMRASVIFAYFFTGRKQSESKFRVKWSRFAISSDVPFPTSHLSEPASLVCDLTIRLFNTFTLRPIARVSSSR